MSSIAFVNELTNELTPNVIAALVGAGATLIAALINLRIAWRREVLDRLNKPRTVRRRRGLLFAITILVLAAGIGGYATALYLMQHEQQNTQALRSDLTQRIAQIQETAVRLEQARLGERASYETETRLREERRRGEEGVVAAARIGACPARKATTEPGAQAVSACVEADAVPIAVCAPVPARATIYEVAPFARFEGDAASWNERRLGLGAQVRGRAGEARIGALPKERADTESTKQVCLDVWSWDTERALDIRVVIKYLLGDPEVPKAPLVPAQSVPTSAPVPPVQAAVGAH